MKISKISLLILGAGVMVIIGIALFLVYTSNMSEREALYISIDSLQQKYAAVSREKRPLEPQVTDLERQIAEFKSASDRFKGEFPGISLQSIEYDEEMTALAADSGVKITRLTAADETAVQEENTTYFVTEYSVEITGERVNLLDFLHRMTRSSYFTTALLKSVTLTEEAEPTPSPLPGGEEEPPSVNFASLFLTFSIYRYGG